MTYALFLSELKDTTWSVLVAVLPLAVLFVAFQALVLLLPRRDFRNVLVGTALSAAGLLLFPRGPTRAPDDQRIARAGAAQPCR